MMTRTAATQTRYETTAIRGQAAAMQGDERGWCAALPGDIDHPATGRVTTAQCAAIIRRIRIARLVRTIRADIAGRT